MTNAPVKSSAVLRPDALTSEMHPLLLFFDGECAFCNRWVNRVKEADYTHRMRYGTKQGKTFRLVTEIHPEMADIDSVVLVKRRMDGGEDFLVRSGAIYEVISGLPEFHLFELLLRIIPTPVSDIGYRIFSSLRSVLFSRWSNYRTSLEQDKELFVD